MREPKSLAIISEGASAKELASNAPADLARPLARVSQNCPSDTPADPDLARLVELWERLPEGGRKLLRQTAEALAGQLTGSPAGGKRRRERRG